MLGWLMPDARERLTETDLEAIERMMDHTGHTSAAMIRVCTRRVDATRDHAAEGLL